jgi:hypothetical protein
MKNTTVLANAAFLLVCFSIVTAQSPPIIISELMINATVGKDRGTWFEFYNPGNQSFVLLSGYLDLQTPLSSPSIFIPSGAMMIPPKGYIMLGNNKNRTTNGNVPVDWEYSPHIDMNEGFGAVTLFNANAVAIVGVYWGTVRIPAQVFVPGASLSFQITTNVPTLTEYVPLNASYYCVSVTSYRGAPMGAKATPNATNACVLPPPTKSPTKFPTKSPARFPTKFPTRIPTQAPVIPPTKSVTKGPTNVPQTIQAPTSMPQTVQARTITPLPPLTHAAAPTMPPMVRRRFTPTKEPRPAAAPIVIGRATQRPTTSPVPLNAAPTTVQRTKCGLLQWRIFCPVTQCGIVGRALGWCKSSP